MIQANADLFVLFLSPSAPASSWVRYETLIAKYEKIRRPSLQLLVVPIDGASYHDAPEWMRRFFTTTPDYNPRDISRLMHELLCEAMKVSGAVKIPPFIGREGLINTIVVECMTRYAARRIPVNFVVLSGLELMGRKAMARHLIPRLYPQARRGGLLLELPSYADAIDLFLALRDELADKQTSADIARAKAHFSALPPEKQAEVIHANLIHFAKINQVITISSAYGLREQRTPMKPWLSELLTKMCDTPDVRVLWVSQRLRAGGIT